MRANLFHCSILIFSIFLLFDIETPQVFSQGRTSGRSREGGQARSAEVTPGSSPSSVEGRNVGRARPSETTVTPTPVSSGSRDIGRTPQVEPPVTAETSPTLPPERPPGRPPFLVDRHPSVIIIQDGGSIIDAPVEPNQPNCFWVRDGVRYGKDVTLANSRVMPEYSGYDFSESLKQPFDHPFTDIFVEEDHGDLMMSVQEDSEIMDIGSILVPSDAICIPRSEWSPTHQERLFLGHEYVVCTWDHQYAKFYITSLLQDRVTFDWAYQCAKEADWHVPAIVVRDRRPGKFTR
jgi:hypothetical protein